MMKTFKVAILAMAASTGVNAAATEGLSREEVRAAIVKAGPTPTYANDRWTVPYNDTMNLLITPFSCDEADEKCGIFVISMAFAVNDAKSELLERVNDFNGSVALSRAVAIEGGSVARLEYQIILDNGAGADYLTARLSEIPTLLKLFNEKVLEPLKPATTP